MYKKDGLSNAGFYIYKAFHLEEVTMRRILGLLLFVVLLYSVPATACTTFAVRDGSGDVSFVGKSYDWETQAGLLIANRTGIEKESLVFPPSGKDCNYPSPLPTKAKTWTSQYYSITVNQYGRDLPNGGMNNKGLVVETMEMDPGSNKACQAVYTPEGASQAINGIQLVQYILDRFDSVDAFVRSVPDFAVVPSTVYLHYMICDASECAVAEIKNNKLVITTERDFPDLSLPPGLEIVNDLRYLALTNDYYDCSFHGRNGNITLALEDYAGFPFGGTRPLPFGPNYCVVPMADICAQRGDCPPPVAMTACDQACRDGGAWYNSNSVERFVRAAAGSVAMSGSSATVDDIFRELNAVVSADGATGGTQWQIAYDIKNQRIHWRTVADGTDPDIGFTGGKRSLGFSDVSFGDGQCTSKDNTQVVNVDKATACASLDDKDSYCNPNPNLNSCPVTAPGCIMSAYEERYNRRLVEFVVKHTWVDQGMGGFEAMVKTMLPGIDDDSAWAIIYNIWGGYPRGYTQCGRAVQPEDKVNLYLSSILDPYINPLIKPQVKNNSTINSKLTYTDTVTFPDILIPVGPVNVPTDFKFKVDGKISGLDNTVLKSLSVTKKSPSDDFIVNGTIPRLQLKGSLQLTTTEHTLFGDVSQKFPNGSITVSVPVDPFSVTLDGAHASDDLSNPLCFDKSKHAKNVAPTLGALSCTVNVAGIDLPHFVTDPLCQNQATELAKLLAETLLPLLVIDVAANIRECGDTTTAETSAPPVLAAGWGGLVGQYVTARAGRTYVLEAEIGADMDSHSYEFATIAEALPGYETICLNEEAGGIEPGWFEPCRHVDIVRLRSAEGSNKVTGLWTPSSEGDKVLLFDVSRWGEESDEVTPAVLHVHVLPAGGPSSWKEMTKEALSVKLKEAK